MTIYDIADLAGVSASSVSRVINGKPGVGKKKREQIEMLLQKYNYTPNANARCLVSQNSYTVGILTDDLTSSRHRDSISMVETELMRIGHYCTVKYLPNGEKSIESCMSELSEMRLKGLVCFGPSFRNQEIVRHSIKKYLSDTPIILVNHTGGIMLDNVYSVGAGEKEGFTNCVRLLAGRGCKNIALMLDVNRVSGAVIRSGFERGIEKCNGVKGTVCDNVAPSLEGGAQAVEELIKSEPQLDGLVCADDLIAIGAMNALLDMGVSVPDQIAIIGENNSLFCDVCRPKMSSLDTMLKSMTLMAVRALSDILAGNNISHSIMLSCDIVERETTRIPKKN